MTSKKLRITTVSYALGAISFLSACQPPVTTGDATNTNVYKGTFGLHALSLTDPILAEPLHVFQPRIVYAQDRCQGSAGSIFPPLLLNGGFASTLMLPINMIADLENAIQGTSDESHVSFPGVERYWVQQNRINDCWAAVLEMARQWNGFYHISQQQILAFAAEHCPEIAAQQEGADTYQIMYVIAGLQRTYGDALQLESFCNTEDCIVDALKRSNPVIMLRSGHATLIVGADYENFSPSVEIRSLEILDPAGDRTIQVKSIFAISKADAFIVY
jgi:hypothetical protein